MKKNRNLIFAKFKARALLLEAEGGGAGGGGGSGGGAAVAEPPAGGASGGSSGEGGFFNGIPERDITEKTAAEPEKTTPEPEKTAAASDAPTKYVVNDDNGKPLAEFDTEAEAKSYIETNKAAGKTPEQLAKEAEAGKTGAQKIGMDTEFETPLVGRYKTPREMQEAFVRAQNEDVRLAGEVKRLTSEREKVLATLESERAAMKAEIETVRKTPPFQELTPEQYKALVKEDPASAVDYRFAKEKHERGIQEAKDQAARQVEQRRQRAETVNAEIQRHRTEMLADNKKYPMFPELQSKREDILEKMGGENSPIRGYWWNEEAIHFMALGLTYRDLLEKGAEVKTDAATEAKAKAEATAKATAGAGGGGPAKPPVKDTEQDRWSKSIDEAGGKKVLSFWDEK